MSARQRENTEAKVSEPETTTVSNGDALIRASIFIASRAGAAVLCQGPETGFKPGWFPRLAQQFVRNADDPMHGYATREEALAAARRYRQSCVEFCNGR